ncbi:hypothetical protein ACWGK5_30335 [Rhodococcus qingshengii]
MKDPYVDPETGVLINKLGHTDPQALLEDEAEAAYQRILQLELQPIAGNFDFDHLKKIHQFILQDVYDWAGTLRTRDGVVKLSGVQQFWGAARHRTGRSVRERWFVR